MPKINFKEAELMAIYIDRLIADKGLATANREQYGELSRQLREQFDEACQKAMISALPDAKLEELSKKLDDGMTDDEIEKFFEGAGVDFPKVVQETMIKFRADYLGKAASEATNVSAASTEKLDAKTAHAENPNLAGAAPQAEKPASTENMTNLVNTNTQPPIGNPAQGTTSVAPGASDVEGVGQKTTITTEEKK